MAVLTPKQQEALRQARDFYVGHKAAVGAMMVVGARTMLIKSGHEGGPFGGTQRGGLPRGRGWAFTQGGPSEANIATHVEGHAAAIMWQRGFTEAVLVVDREMCDVCSRNLSSALPPGATMIVISEEEGRSVVFSNHAAPRLSVAGFSGAPRGETWRDPRFQPLKSK